ncbi:MAG: hypothetical protein JXA54_05330 [Candidatus Heimdallarchaeota archaeon]|nr:hypothetical protein [Candidatus Heimdallarchaeota archaeon]
MACKQLKRKIKKEKAITKEEQINTVEFNTKDAKIKKIGKLIVTYSEEYDKKIRNLQIIALILILVMTLIAPLRLFDSKKLFDITAVGFVIAGMVPAIIAIFDFMRGRKLCLYLSTLIYGTWIIVSSVFYWEIILLTGLVVIYFEITRVLQLISPLLANVQSIANGGAYYHANVYLKRYIIFLLKYSGIILGFTMFIGILGRYVFVLIQGDILFSIFIIVCLILVLILSRRVITLDIQKILIKEQKERMEEDLSKTYSKYS